MDLKSRWILIDPEVSRNHALADIPQQIQTSEGNFGVVWQRLEGGRRQGVELLWIDNGQLKVAIVPTRGMGLWKAWLGDLEFGWQSPVKGPIHPQWVAVHDPSGLGWLDGFDELLVRCGLESHGAPEFSSQGQLKYPLHGRIANLAAQELAIEADREAGTLDVIGWVDESRFLVRGLRLEARYRFHADSNVIEVTDRVTNLSANPVTMQMLYHINVGEPILEAGSRVFASLRKLAPRNARAAAAIDQWDTYQAPEAGFAEQVYFGEPATDQEGWASALLCNHAATRGIGVHYDTSSLPCLSLWKNTAARQDGYVTGIEPATGFPNRRSFEASKQRLVCLAGGEVREFRLKLELVQHPDHVAEIQRHVGSLNLEPLQVLRAPEPNWSDK